MKTVFYFPALFLGWIIASSACAQTSFQCPDNIGYQQQGIPDCGGSLNQPGFYIHFPGNKPSSLSFYLNFDGTNCQGQQAFTNLLCGGWVRDISGVWCLNPNPTGILQIQSENTVCHYSNGELDGQYTIGCYNFINSCQAKLVEYAKKFAPDPPDCKLWEGPCATESEIWRTGTVIIGAGASSDGFNLGVRGGIRTEMLQICKTEWCDYVFADSFHLMPLPQVKNYIQKNGYLPGCVSAKSIQQNGGFLLEEATIAQQQKIEEIYLHIINSQHRLEKVEKDLKRTDNNIIVEMPSVAPEVREKAFSEEKQEEILTQVTCFQIKPAPEGIIGVVVTPNSGPYNLSWSGASNGTMTGVNCSGAIRINNLPAGVYTIYVRDAQGVVIGSCATTLSQGTGGTDCSIINSPECKDAIVNLLEEEGFDTPPKCRQWEGDPCSHTGNIYRMGNVGIGTSFGKSGFSLAVKGGIVADGLRVELCGTGGWCDYVFDKDYALTPLPEVEAFIKTNRHLPGSITTSEVLENNGFELRSVNLDQQKKLEEAFLYLIELNKKKKELQRRLDNLLSDQ